MNDSGTIASWLQVGVGLIALVLFIIVERKNLFPNRPKKFLGALINKQPKDNTSTQSSDHTEKGDIDLRAGIYSRALVGIIFGITLGNVYARISNYYQHSFNRNEVAVLVTAIPISLIISLVYDRTTPSLKSFFVHWIERLIIVFVYLYIFSTYVFCYNYGNPPYECKLILWERVLIITAIFMILISYPSTPIDWLLHLVKKGKVNDKES